VVAFGYWLGDCGSSSWIALASARTCRAGAVQERRTRYGLPSVMEARGDLLNSSTNRRSDSRGTRLDTGESAGTRPDECQRSGPVADADMAPSGRAWRSGRRPRPRNSPAWPGREKPVWGARLTWGADQGVGR